MSIALEATGEYDIQGQTFRLTRIGHDLLVGRRGKGERSGGGAAVYRVSGECALTCR